MIAGLIIHDIGGAETRRDTVERAEIILIPAPAAGLAVQQVATCSRFLLVARFESASGLFRPVPNFARRNVSRRRLPF
jgi:hypothetical protein